MVLRENKKARFDFEIEEEFEAGIKLLGCEVKSIKSGNVQMAGSFVIIRGGEVFWVGATIQPYQISNIVRSYDPQRPRKLLLTKKEIEKINGAVSKRGLALIAISLYNKGKGGNIKLKFGLGKHKKKHDKRETIKKREAKRDAIREMKY